MTGVIVTRIMIVMEFANPLLLFGLAAAAIPPIVQVIRRRRYDVVDWGAMQFLRLTPRARRKLLLEQYLLMALRMAALALLAVSLAGPSVRSGWLARLQNRQPRDTVILVDLSASMAQPGEPSPIDVARERVKGFADRMRPGDRVAVLGVKGGIVPILDRFTGDPERVRSALELLPIPWGTPDWPAAIARAAGLLTGAAGEPEILVLTDGQRFGWADPDTFARWEALAHQLAASGKALPRVWVVTTAAGGRPQVRQQTIAGQVESVVIRPDPRELDLTPSSDAERARVAALLGSVTDIRTLEELEQSRGRGPVVVPLRGALLILVFALFAADLWYTRRFRNRG